MKKCGAVIVAAGKGTRMGANVKKQFIKLNGIEILARTVSKFENSVYIGQIILAVPDEDVEYCGGMAEKYGWKKTTICRGGRERQDSVYNGVKELDGDTDIVLIHDGVRPFVNEKDILSVIEGVEKTGACALAVPVKDTVKVCSNENIVLETPNRDSLWAMQTPQGFNYKLIKEAYEKLPHGFAATDDAMVMEFAGHKVYVTMGSYRNIKITTPDDILFGESILKGEAE